MLQALDVLGATDRNRSRLAVESRTQRAALADADIQPADSGQFERLLSFLGRREYDLQEFDARQHFYRHVWTWIDRFIWPTLESNANVLTEETAGLIVIDSNAPAEEVVDYLIGIDVRGSTHRPFALLEWASTLPKESGPIFWEVVAEIWSICDLIPHDQFSRKFRYFREYAPEVDVPSHLTIFRGQDRFNNLGLSWTSDRSIAETFASGHRFTHNQHPAIFTATVRRKDVALVINDREESEIVLFKAPHRRRCQKELLIAHA